MHKKDIETKCVCVQFKNPHFTYLHLFLMQAHMPKSRHTCTRTGTNSHTWHNVCLNNRFLVQCAELLWVWLEPLGDLSVRAMQAGNPSTFALGSRGTLTGPLNSWPWYPLCFALWTLTPEMYDTHAYTHTACAHAYMERAYKVDTFAHYAHTLTHTA